ncbi:MAG: glycoside hydrolase family 5 protein [Oscillospiraceae bacterium]|jgi:endoglucanase|nr:glycoside hydrolase family 5 protein [Oscillospiraceae bacterium]
MKKIVKRILLVLLVTFVCLGGVAVWRVGLLAPGHVKNPVIPDTPGFALVKELQLGWNLGNTLEAHQREDTYGLDDETRWGNPKTTQAMIDAVKAAGFATVRVPVTWAYHMGDAPDYTIDAAWLDRVQEVVDYAYERDLFVILNMHHDDAYWFIPDKKHEAATTAQFTRLWEQLADRFADYGEKLLFEAANEPRVVGTLLEWGGGTMCERAVLGRLNAKFVETVRASGGQNATRWLLIPTYGASYEPVPMAALKLPDDPRLIVSIHAYAPLVFAFENKAGAKSTPDSNEFTDAVRQQVDKTLGRIYRTFVAKGIPVYLGEFGAVSKDNEPARAEYAAHYLREAARYGMTCGWWDNGGSGTSQEVFALLDRDTLTWKYPALLAALDETAHENS